MGNASHPLRFLLFVSPAPDTLVPEVTVEVEESDNNPTFTTQTDTVQLVDNREDDSEPDYKYLLAVGVLVGSLILVGGRN